MNRLGGVRDERRMDTERLMVWLVFKIDPENAPFFSKSLKKEVVDAGAECRIVRKRFVSVKKPETKYPDLVVLELDFLRSCLPNVVNAIQTKDPDSGVVVVRSDDGPDFALEMVRAGTRMRFRRARSADLERKFDAPFVEVKL